MVDTTLTHSGGNSGGKLPFCCTPRINLPKAIHDGPLGNVSRSPDPVDFPRCFNHACGCNRRRAVHQLDAAQLLPQFLEVLDRPLKAEAPAAFIANDFHRIIQGGNILLYSVRVPGAVKLAVITADRPGAIDFCDPAAILYRTFLQVSQHNRGFSILGNKHVHRPKQAGQVPGTIPGRIENTSAAGQKKHIQPLCFHALLQLCNMGLIFFPRK